MTDLIRLVAAELAAKIAAKEVSSVEVTQACLDQIEAHRRRLPRLPARRRRAGAGHAAADRRDGGGRRANCRRRWPVSRWRSRTCSPPPTCRPPAGRRSSRAGRRPYDATVTARLRAAGIPILGKTNMDEFAMGSSTENSAYGPTRNPWDTDRVPGGSGGGSAAALAAFQAPLAIGSDTGGSIRQPAALTATVGVKPTYGTVSRYGLIACASSLDQGGPCARTVLDTALLHQVIAGHDPRDSTSVEAAVPDVVAAAQGRRGRRPDGRAGRRGHPVAQRRGLPARRAGVVQRRRRAAARARRRGQRGRLPAHRLLDGRLLPDPAVGGVEQPGPLRRDALRPAGRRRRHAQRRGGDGADPGRRVRPGSQAPHHDRHLRAVGGLLRRLLQPGAEGAHADRPRPRRGLQVGRRAGLARPLRPPRSGWGRRSTIRWRCTCSTCARCR